LIDFLERSVPDAAIDELAPIFSDRANIGDGTVVGTSVVLAQVFLVLTD
jgi:hypothetical protein